MKASKFRKWVCGLMASTGSVVMVAGCPVSANCSAHLHEGVVEFHDCSAELIEAVVVGTD